MKPQGLVLATVFIVVAKAIAKCRTLILVEAVQRVEFVLFGILDLLSLGPTRDEDPVHCVGVVVPPMWCVQGECVCARVCACVRQGKKCVRVCVCASLQS